MSGAADNRRLRPANRGLLSPALLAAGLLALPGAARAQAILGIVIALASVPLLNAVLVVVFALVRRSLRAFVLHSGLVVVWVVLFWLFSSFTGSDFLAWLPIGLSIAHSLLLVSIILYRSVRGCRPR